MRAFYTNGISSPERQGPLLVQAGDFVEKEMMWFL